MSKWDYEGIVFDDAKCKLELHKIIMKKKINDSNIDKIKKKLKETIKNNALLDVDITSQVDEDTLILTISDAPGSTTQPAPVASAEYFSTQLAAVVYIYNTSNNLAVADALNDASVDPSDIIGEETTQDSTIYILLIVFIILLIFIILKLTHTI
jgi:hypothetical protein